MQSQKHDGEGAFASCQILMAATQAAMILEVTQAATTEESAEQLEKLPVSATYTRHAVVRQDGLLYAAKLDIRFLTLDLLTSVLLHLWHCLCDLQAVPTRHVMITDAFVTIFLSHCNTRIDLAKIMRLPSACTCSMAMFNICAENCADKHQRRAETHTR